MSIFPEDKHLEVYMKPNKEPEKGPSPTTIILNSLIISIPISVAFSLTLFEEFFGIENNFNLYPDQSEEFQQSPNPPPHIPDEYPDDPPVEGYGTSAIPSSDISYGLPFAPYRVSIVASCNGLNVMGAEFRIEPSMADSAIQGVVLPEQWVSLTGITAYDKDVDVIWFQAINQSELAPSANPKANNQLFELQQGWIHECFVKEFGYPR
jgi:hypothetical protein